MNSYDDTTRSRYWRETIADQFKSKPWIPLLLIFLVASQVIGHSGRNGVFIFILAIVFGGMLFGRRRSRSAPDIPAFPNAAAPGATNADLQRLFTVLEQLEKRLVNLEEAVTQKEFDWERRLNQEGPRSAGAAPSAGPAS
jgi:hypothetical protein